MDLRPGWGDDEMHPLPPHPPLRRELFLYAVLAALVLGPLYVLPWVMGWH